jgi:hypothetical protein
MASMQEMTRITNRHYEIMGRIAAGALDAEAVLRMQERLLKPAKADDSQLDTWPPTTPRWYRTPEQQIERARQLWGEWYGVVTDLPEPPAGFVAQTKSEVLLLHVPLPFDELLRAVEAPAGYVKKIERCFNSDKLSLAPNIPVRTDPVWVAFDPNANHGEDPEKLWGQPDLAASEVLSALIQFPDWPLSWDGESDFYPYLSGYQYWYDLWDDEEWHVPQLFLFRSELRVSYAGPENDTGERGSPRVRDC